MPEAVPSKTESRKVRPAGGATSERRPRRDRICADPVSGEPPAHSGFRFRLAIRHRKSVNRRGLPRAGFDCDPPQIGGSFP